MNTPQQVQSHKSNWMPGYAVRLHSDVSSEGKHWCKSCLPRESWSYRKNTAPYEDTFHFEFIEAAQNFEMEFGGFANQ